jgi:salicylate hydroxylase
MPHRQQHYLDDAAYYEQRHNKDASASEESKRRKMIRWIKKSFGLAEDSSKHLTKRRDPMSPSGHNHPNVGKSREVSSRSTTSASNHQHLSYTDVMSSYSMSGSLPPAPPPVFSNSMHHDGSTHVLIIGAGLGGLCLAQGLRKHGIPFTVFERDPSPNYRSQGYRVRIDSMGYEALKANLSATNVEVLLRATGHFLPSVTYVDAATGATLGGSNRQAFEQQQPSNKPSRLPHHHIFSPDRAMLRSLLLTDLDEGDVQYGMAFKRYDVLPSGRVQVTFENGAVIDGSLLVGADGTTSRVRRQYIPHHVSLLDTDTGAIYGKTPRSPALEALFPPDSSTTVLSASPHMSLVVEPRGRATISVGAEGVEGVESSGHDLDGDISDYIGWVLIARARHLHCDASMNARELFSLPSARVAQLSVDMTRDWDPRVRSLLAQQVPDWCVLLRICSMSPKLKPWTPSPVTLLGDAVHTMAPAGLGCNTALYDAQVLVRALLERGVTVDAVASYERELRAAGAEGITLSMDACAKTYGLPRVEDMEKIG